MARWRGEQTYFNMFGTLPMAEVASTFGEMLVFDQLQTGASPETRLAMLADKIEGAIGTIMSTTGRYRLEKTIHRQRRTTGEMTPGADFGPLAGGNGRAVRRQRGDHGASAAFLELYPALRQLAVLLVSVHVRRTVRAGAVPEVQRRRPGLRRTVSAPAAGGRQRLAACAGPYCRRRSGRPGVLARRLPRGGRAD